MAEARDEPREIEDDPAEMVRHVAYSVARSEDTQVEIDQLRDSLAKFIDARIAAVLSPSAAWVPGVEDPAEVVRRHAINSLPEALRVPQTAATLAHERAVRITVLYAFRVVSPPNTCPLEFEVRGGHRLTETQFITLCRLLGADSREVLAVARE